MADVGRALAEGEIRDQIRRGSDMSVPVDVREGTTPRVDGVVLCRDNQTPLEHSKAEVVKEGQDQTPLALPSDAARIDRNAPIAVVRGEGENSPVEYISDIGGQGKPEAARPDPVYAERPSPSDNIVGISPDAVEARHFEAPAHGIGVQPVVKEETRLSGLAEVREQGQPFQKTAEVVPTAPEVIPAVMGSSELPATAMPANQQVMPQIMKQQVTISSQTMGRHRVRVAMASVSESVVILGYHNVEDAAIIEPPMANKDNPLQITIGDQTYPCASYGFTAEDVFMGVPLLLVVLVRLRE